MRVELCRTGDSVTIVVPGTGREVTIERTRAGGLRVVGGDNDSLSSAVLDGASDDGVDSDREVERALANGR